VLDKLYDLLHASGSHLKFPLFLEIVLDLVAHFESDYLKDDKDIKNAAIDAACEILQKHKE